MASLPDDDDLRSELLTKRILDALQDGISAGEGGPARMVTSFLISVEVFDAEGQSKILMLASDNRLSVNLGLNTYAGIFLGSQVS